MTLLEFAQHIKRTHAVHEQSWMNGIPGGTGYASHGFYRMTYEQAARAAMVPDELVLIISILLMTGYVDVHEWADAQLNPYGDDVAPPQRRLVEPF